MSTTVFVLGATGYIALHTVKDLINKGYSVVGSVRSEAKGDKLVKQLGEKFSYEVVPDIAVKGAFDEALKKHPEVSVFLHTASPFHFNVTDIEKQLLTPAIEGTTNALKAIKAYGPQIKRVVVTSSYAAIGSAEADVDTSLTISEETWNPVTWEKALENPILGYYGSKTFAEKAAWDFYKNEKPNFILSTVNPVYVFGPQAFDEDVRGTLNTSAEIINGLLKLNKSDSVPPYKGLYIDVRDVSKAHIVAFESDAAKEERLLLSDDRFSSQQLLDILHSKFPEYADRLPIGNPGEGASTGAKVVNDKTRKILGFDFINLEGTTVDTLKQIIEANK
ncbi:hypothetical protein QCA50_018145 [Cerrena zonata]|uniref:NAD-dependent epimerase/dehydratase domain-containing protein n=1 Tax=Cerrena zonata TaxID=2478898 RepID=A0AAW0FMT7_9APHY